MTERIYNFSAGPSTLPETVLEEARDELLSHQGTGMSVMEISHRSKQFQDVIDGAEAGLRGLLDIPDNYRILFLQGGATLQFSMIPMNFLRTGETADYVVTGAWGKKALKEAQRRFTPNVVFDSGDDGFRSVPDEGSLTFDSDARYIHYTSNETIEGVEFKYELNEDGIPVICDASSNILSKPIEMERYAMIYAGAQKNIGPSGVTVVIIRDDLLERVPADQYTLLDYRAIAGKGSMLNTPNTWGIYLIDLVCKWVRGCGGLEEMEKRNVKKAGLLYKAIDGSDGFYKGHAERKARSLMNVTFNLPTPELETMFAEYASARGLNGLKGHRSVGGIRASIYNAFPFEGVEALTSFMKEFAESNAAAGMAGRP